MADTHRLSDGYEKAIDEWIDSIRVPLDQIAESFFVATSIKHTQRNRIRFALMQALRSARLEGRREGAEAMRERAQQVVLDVAAAGTPHIMFADTVEQADQLKAISDALLEMVDAIRALDPELPETPTD